MGKTRILVVEDEILVARDIKAKLEFLGYEVTGIASTGPEALEMIHKESPDLAIIDIVLKGAMDGVEVARKMRRDFNIPFLYLTALSDPNTIERAKITVPFGYIIKPFEQNELLAAIETALFKYKMELKIRESEEKYRNLFENAVEGIFQTTAEGRFLAANPAMARMLGYVSPEDLIASRTDIARQGYVLPEKREEFMVLLEKFGEVRGFELQAYRQDRSIVWLSENVRLVRDKQGKILFFEGTAQDITDRKRTEEMLQESEERFRRLSEATLEGIIFHDKGKIIDANEAFATMFGYSLSEVIGKNALDFATPELREAALSHIRDGSEALYDGVAIRKDGSTFLVEVHGKNAFYKGRSIRLTAVRDITERKQMEETLAKYIGELQQLSKKMISVQEAERLKISHELHDEMGQALTMLRLNIASLRDILAPEHIGEIKKKIADADALTEKLLGQIHELTLDLRPHMLDDLGLVPTLRWYSDRMSRRLNIRILFTPKNWRKRLDSEISTAIFRIIQEAMTNVVKYARAKKVRIRLVQKQKVIEALIEDDGCGFDQKKIEKRKSPARGIGLFSMKERAALLNGECTIESQPGKGTRIHIRIPWRKAGEKN